MITRNSSSVLPECDWPRDLQRGIGFVPTAEKAETFATVVAYAGRYTFTGDKVVHHVEASWMPNQVGTDLVRLVTIHGNRLVLRTPPMLEGGHHLVTELI